MSSNSDSQNISRSPSVMTDSDVNSDSTSSSSIELVNSPAVNVRKKSQNDCSTSGRDEPALHASPLGVVVGLGNALEVPVYGQYGTMVGLAERSPELFPPVGPSSSRLVGLIEKGLRPGRHLLK